MKITKKQFDRLVEGLVKEQWADWELGLGEKPDEQDEKFPFPNDPDLHDNDLEDEDLNEQFEWTDEELASMGDEESDKEEADQWFSDFTGELTGTEDEDDDYPWDDEFVGKADRSERGMQEAKKNRCWDGYKPVKDKKPYSKGSCEKVDEAVGVEQDEELEQARRKFIGKKITVKDGDVVRIVQVTREERSGRLMAWYEYERVQVHTGWVWVDKLEEKLQEAKKKKNKSPSEKVRKPTAPPSRQHKDPTKYDRKRDKKNVDLNEMRPMSRRGSMMQGKGENVSSFFVNKMMAEIKRLLKGKMDWVDLDSIQRLEKALTDVARQAYSELDEVD